MQDSGTAAAAGQGVLQEEQSKQGTSAFLLPPQKFTKAFMVPDGTKFGCQRFIREAGKCCVFPGREGTHSCAPVPENSDVLQLSTKLLRQQIGEIGKWNREKWNERQFREEKPGTKPRFSGRTKCIRSSEKGLGVRALWQGAMGPEVVASTFPKPQWLEFSALPGQVITGTHWWTW